MNNPKRTVAATVAFILAVVGIIATLGLSGCTGAVRLATTYPKMPTTSTFAAV